MREGGFAVQAVFSRFFFPMHLKKIKWVSSTNAMKIKNLDIRTGLGASQLELASEQCSQRSPVVLAYRHGTQLLSSCGEDWPES